MERQRDKPQELPQVGDAARRELVVVDRVLAERRELAIGAAANGTGKTTIPFWDGSMGYETSVTIG